MKSKLPPSVVHRINAQCEHRDSSHEDLTRSSAVYAELVGMTNRHLKSSRDGGMSVKQKVLTLLAVHSIQGSEQNIEFAMTASLQAGASEAEIRDSLDLALLTGGGSAVWRVQFAANVLKLRLSAAGGGSEFDFIREARELK